MALGSLVGTDEHVSFKRGIGCPCRLLNYATRATAPYTIMPLVTGDRF